MQRTHTHPTKRFNTVFAGRQAHALGESKQINLSTSKEHDPWAADEIAAELFGRKDEFGKKVARFCKRAYEAI